MLTGEGATLALVCDGRWAVEAVERRPGAFDLILMDMQMPVLDGPEATAAIRRLPGYRLTPILAMTASDFPEDIQRCLDAGMNDHLAKPVDPAVLYQSLLRWLPATARNGKPEMHSH